MECSRADSVWSNPLDGVVEDDASFRRRLEVALRGLNYTDGADKFIQLHCDGHSLPLVVDFMESALDGGFPLAHVIVALREQMLTL